MSNTPLYYAVKARYLDAVGLLLDHGADPNKGSLIKLAYDRNHDMSMMGLLIQYGIDIPNNCMADIISANHTILIEAIMNYGTYHHRSYLLRYSVRCNNEPMISTLISMGIDNDIKIDALYIARSPNAIRALIGTGILDVNTKNIDGRTPIYEAADVDCARMLIQYGADLSVTDNHGLTPCKYIQIYRSNDTKLGAYMLFTS